jgi:hypothetical protein
MAGNSLDAIEESLMLVASNYTQKLDQARKLQETVGGAVSSIMGIAEQSNATLETFNTQAEPGSAGVSVLEEVEVRRFNPKCLSVGNLLNLITGQKMISPYTTVTETHEVRKTLAEYILSVKIGYTAALTTLETHLQLAKEEISTANETIQDLYHLQEQAIIVELQSEEELSKAKDTYTKADNALSEYIESHSGEEQNAAYRAAKLELEQTKRDAQLRVGNISARIRAAKGAQTQIESFVQGYTVMVDSGLQHLVEYGEEAKKAMETVQSGLRITDAQEVAAGLAQVMSDVAVYHEVASATLSTLLPATAQIIVNVGQLIRPIYAQPFFDQSAVDATKLILDGQHQYREIGPGSEQ